MTYIHAYIYAELTEKLKEVVPHINPERRNREYTTPPEEIARQFLRHHYKALGDRERDYHSLLPSFYENCVVNLGSNRAFKGPKEAAEALVLSCAGESIDVS